ncbi:MAG TPA: PAS domain S-box protein [Bryobacteraceae bacterium]|nr:PAS domain S-box protein [Bryobacteraceae bacterium]
MSDISAKLTRDQAPGEKPDHSVPLALLAAIVESSDDAIVSKTLEGKIQSWNTAAERIFGYTAAEVIGQPITIIVPPELHDEEQRILERLHRGQRVDHFDTIRVTKDGRRIPISLTVSPIRDSRGVIVGASKVARDISERKRWEQALLESESGRKRNEEALRDAYRRKDEFLALIGHELRNLISPIRYSLDINKKAGRTPEQRRRSEEIMERQIMIMSRLLDDLLDASRISRSMLQLSKTTTEIALVVGAAIDTARPVLEAKNHSLSLDLPKHAIRFEADSARLAQVFSNLLINAAKYTDPGGQIHLRARREGNEINVSIRDNGIGISAEMVPRLFTMFTQAPGALSRADGGLGIGLSLVEGLVALHGGRVEARSDGPGTGSEFIVHLPIGAPAENPHLGAAKQSFVPGESLKILVVDDNPEEADSCTILLELSGHHAQTAYTGQRALELAEAFRPHALIMDIGLPDFDGYQLAKAIRAAPWGGSIALIAVTGWAQEEDRQRAFAAGCDHCLTKPIAAESVESLLRSLHPGPRD